jgi:hypothetical protein
MTLLHVHITVRIQAVLGHRYMTPQLPILRPLIVFTTALVADCIVVALKFLEEASSTLAVVSAVFAKLAAGLLGEGVATAHGYDEGFAHVGRWCTLMGRC